MSSVSLPQRAVKAKAFASAILAAVAEPIPAPPHERPNDVPWDQVALVPPELVDDAAEEPSAPGEPAIPFADWLAVQAQLMRVSARRADCGFGDQAALIWLARRIDDLAGLAKTWNAASPAAFEAAELSMEWSRELEIERQGEATGYDRCAREAGIYNY